MAAYCDQQQARHERKRRDPMSTSDHNQGDESDSQNSVFDDGDGAVIIWGSVGRRKKRDDTLTPIAVKMQRDYSEQPERIKF